MDRPTIISRLRITTSVVFGVLCVAPIALWVRSYSWHGRLKLNYAIHVECQTIPGELFLAAHHNPWDMYKESKYKPDPRRLWHWSLVSRPLPDQEVKKMGFRWHVTRDGFEVIIPHWCPALVFGALAAAFGLARRIDSACVLC